MTRRWPALPAAAILLLVLWRAVLHPVDTYGDSGAGYIEHLERVRVLSRLTTAGGSIFDRLRAADGLYPPGLHLLSAPASFLGAHHPEAVTPLGILWLLLLAGAVATCARTLHKRALMPAFVATLLVPAFHAVAPRYYYDLPMTALVWTAAAALASSDKNTVPKAILAALAFSLACFVKWSAIPLGASILVAGALLAARHDRRRALQASSLAVGLTTLIVVPTLLASTSFGAMGGATFQPPPGVALPTWTAALNSIRPGLGHALGSMAVQARLDGPARAWFYFSRLGSTVLAPALVPSTLTLVAIWARTRAPGALALAVAALPVVAFILLAVPPLDERFLLTVLPVIPLVAGVALSESTRLTRILAPVTAALAVAVAADFHLGGPFNGAETPATTGHATPLRWGLSTSIDRRGWARSDHLPDHRSAFRAALLEQVDRCHATSITGDDAIVADKGDLNWWTFAFERATLAHDAPQRVFMPIGTGLGPPPSPPTLAFTHATPPDGFAPLTAHLAIPAFSPPGLCESFQ